MMSAFTGFTDSCWSNAPNSFIENTNVDSIYSKLVQRNRCNLNDFQNQANNGCKAKYMAELGFQNDLIGLACESLAPLWTRQFENRSKKTIFGLNRKPTDKPMLVFLSLIGNDVCNGKVRSKNNFWNHMFPNFPEHSESVQINLEIWLSTWIKLLTWTHCY